MAYTTPAQTPSAVESDEADAAGLALAKQEGDAYGRTLKHMTDDVADTGGEQAAGDYLVGYALEEAEGMYELVDGELQWMAPDEENLHVEVAVRDGADGRFIPGLTIHATLIAADGTEVGTHLQPFLWHPYLLHYGRNWVVPGDGAYTLRITIEPPDFMRHDKINGKRFAETVHVEFTDVQVKTGKESYRPMRISKFLHSCLVFEQDGYRVLFDPGTFSFAEGRVRPEQLGGVSHIVLTHNHPDHIDPTALARIVALSGAPVIGNGEVVSVLAEQGIAAQEHNEGPIQAGPFALRAIPSPHEPILTGTLPRHTAYLIDDRVLHGVDSFGTELDAFAEPDLLIMPVMAPFLTEVGAFAFAARIRPKAVLPVHDGYARDFFVAARYDAYEPFLAKIGIAFHRVSEPGASISV